MQFYRAWQESKCPYFLYENNYSIHKNIKAFITERLGVWGIMINSALVSAQQRKRCYWTNIPNVKLPKDKGILLKDVLESGVAWQDKAYAYTTRCQGAMVKDTLECHRHTMVVQPINLSDYVPFQIICNLKKYNEYAEKHNKIPVMFNAYNCKAITDKSPTKELFIYRVKDGKITIKDKTYSIRLPDGYYIICKLTPVEAERLQTLPDNYTEGISNTQRYKCIGNGWTVDVIAHILSYLTDFSKKSPAS